MKSRLAKQSLIFISLVLCLFIRVDYEVEFNDFSIDKVYQIMASRGVEFGEGAKVPYVDPNNPDKNSYSSLKGYPPLYSYMIAATTVFTGYKYADIFLDCVFIIVFILFFYATLCYLKFNYEQKVLSLFFLAVTPFPFAVLSSTDLIIGSLFMVLVFVFIRYIFATKRSLKIFTAIILILIPPIMVSLKYSSYPLLLFVPGILFIYSISIKKYKLMFNGALFLIGSILTLLLIKTVLPDYPKDKVFEAGFYPENILQFDHFLVKSFFYIDDFIAGKEFIYPLYKLLSTILTVFIVFWLIRYLLKIAFSKLKTTSPNLILLITAVSTVLIVSFLVLLSIRTKPETWQDPPWTYVEESRYYFPAIIAFQIFILSLVFTKSNNLKRSFKTSLNTIVVLSLFFNVAYTTKQFYNTKMTNEKKYTFGWNFKDNLETIEELNTINSNHNLIYTNENITDGVTTSAIGNLRFIRYQDLQTLENKKSKEKYIIAVQSKSETCPKFNNENIKFEKKINLDGRSKSYLYIYHLI